MKKRIAEIRAPPIPDGLSRFSDTIGMTCCEYHRQEKLPVLAPVSIKYEFMGSMKIILSKEDIITLPVDAIVNAANAALLGGGGVDGAIHRAGGPAIMAECDQIRIERGGCPTGQAVITTAGNLTASYVIHTAGPIWSGGDRDESLLLASCYRKSLELAEKHKVSTLAFPNISTGIYGFPKKEAAEIAIQEVSGFVSHVVQTVIFVCFDTENFDMYNQRLTSANIPFTIR